MAFPLAKSVICISPVSKTAAATATGTIDTLGYDKMILNVNLTTSDDATNNPSVLKLEEGDTTSSFATCGLTGDTNFTIGACDTTADHTIAQFRLNLHGRKRYLKLSVSPLTTQTVWADGVLLSGEKSPISTTDAGCQTLVAN